MQQIKQLHKAINQSMVGLYTASFLISVTEFTTRYRSYSNNSKYEMPMVFVTMATTCVILLASYIFVFELYDEGSVYTTICAPKIYAKPSRILVAIFLTFSSTLILFAMVFFISDLNLFFRYFTAYSVIDLLLSYYIWNTCKTLKKSGFLEEMYRVIHHDIALIILGVAGILITRSFKEDWQPLITSGILLLIVISIILGLVYSQTRQLIGDQEIGGPVVVSASEIGAQSTTRASGHQNVFFKKRR